MYALIESKQRKYKLYKNILLIEMEIKDYTN